MKKRKTYEISVIDKTYSNTISDETKFYTSDTALELGFELKETEYNFESAEIVLLNIDDRSLVTRPVAKVLDGFTYELEDDITVHYGEWRGQLRFEQGGEIYVSSPVKFRIENDLSNDRPPQLSDVQSWVSLKRYADGLVDELKQAVEESVANVEAMDDTFKANELDRDKAERERQARFEDAESEREKGESIRVETFQTNEANRQNQFETAEQSRQTTFETNESERDETFSTNETARKSQELEREKAEGTRQQAETQRATAESSRVSAEAQRKADHANRSAELAGKADKVIIKNQVKNGDFSNGTTGWTSLNSDINTTLNEASFIANAPNGRLLQRLNIQNNGQKLYLYSHVKSNSNLVWISLHGSNDIVYHSGSGQYEILSSVHTKYTTGSSFQVQVVDSRNSGWTAIYVKNTLLINLTETFGVGKEPSKEEMDELIKVTGYIDGEYALSNKEMLIWTLALIRRNKNAIISLGGRI